MTKEVKNFQTETKELLNLVTHSIYTHKEIFLRELISNASDAIDKMRFLSLTNPEILEGDEKFKIELIRDEKKKILTLKDNGIGMNHDDVVSNIGTIAKSGSKAFLSQLKKSKEQSDEVDIIGQFGVGFYSAFMVADKITLITKRYDDENAVKWESKGDGTYTIEPIDRKARGTEIMLHLKKDEDDSNYEFLSEYKLRELVKKYSDYIRYPILTTVEREEPSSTKDGDVEKTKEEITLNSMIPLWKKNKNNIEEKEYNEFYMNKFHDWIEPLKAIHIKAEGNVEYTALIYIPSRAPMDFYSKDFEKGIQLYTKNVFIMDKCKELVPEHFRFIKGLVDSADFSLNISREILQQDRQLQIIAKNIEKRVQKELEKLMNDDRETYSKFFKEFGVIIKAGIYENFGLHKDTLKNLLAFYSTHSDKMTSLEEYASRMPEDQKYIYYVAGENKESSSKLPQMEVLKDKGFEVLFFTDRVDEFAIKTLVEFDGKEFKSVTEEDIDLGENETDKKLLEEKEEENKDLLEKIKEHLGNKISSVRLSKRLKTSAVCLVSGEAGISFEMEKVLSEMPGETPMSGMKAERILEINPDHELFQSLKKISETSPEDLDDFADLLYSQALLIEGFALENPVEFANKMAKLMIKASK
jgi:molecular chaperone HtpG